MEIGLVWIRDPEINKFGNMSNQFEKDLKEYFKHRDYGDGIKDLCIGIICTNPLPGFEQFGEPRKPKYTYEYKTYTRTWGTYTVGRLLEYSIKLDFKTFRNASDEEAEKILTKEIMSSLTVFDKMKKKIKDFDDELFKKDLEQYFKEKDYAVKPVQQDSQGENAIKPREVPEEVTAALNEISKLIESGITPESSDRINELFKYLGEQRKIIEKENNRNVQSSKKKVNDNFSNQKINKKQIIKELIEFKSHPKFENGFNYPETDNEALQKNITIKYDRIIDDFISAIEMNANEKELQQVIKNGLSLFEEEKYLLDTEDREQICLYFENIMDIIELESSDGALNEWMYGF